MVIPANTAMRVFSYIVEIIDDDVVESNESFSLSLPEQASVDYTIGDNATLSATIEDNDCMICNHKNYIILLIVSYSLCHSCYRGHGSSFRVCC